MDVNATIGAAAGGSVGRVRCARVLQRGGNATYSILKKGCNARLTLFWPVFAAGTLFRQDGFDGMGVADIMKRAEATAMEFGRL